MSPTHFQLYAYPPTVHPEQRPDDVAQCLLVTRDRALPLGWLLLFGSRNIWEPGDSVKDRGGAAAQRDGTITQCDAARMRLSEALAVLARPECLGPVAAPLRLLDALLDGVDPNGHLRLIAPVGSLGGTTTAEIRASFLGTVAMVENFVFYLDQQHDVRVRQAQDALRKQGIFIPTGVPQEDLQTLQNRMRSEDSLASLSVEDALSRVLIGSPPDDATRGRISTFSLGELKAWHELARKPLPPGGGAAARQRGGGAAAPGAPAGGPNASTPAQGDPAAETDKPWWAFWRK